MPTLIQNFTIISKILLVLLSTWLSFVALRRAQEKKTNIASSMFYAIVFFTLAIVFEIAGQLFEINGIQIGSATWGAENTNWIGNWILSIIGTYHLAEIFMILSVYKVYQFSNQLKESNNRIEKKERIARFFALGILIFGIIKIVLPFQPNSELGIFFYIPEIYVMLYSIIYISSFIQSAAHDMQQIQNDSPKNYNRMKDIMWTAVLWLMQIVFMAIENILLTKSIVDQGVWILSFVYGVSLIFLAYNAFYKREKSPNITKQVVFVGISPFIEHQKN